MECSEEKHSSNFMGYTPEEFAEKFVKTSYFFQKRAFLYIAREYEKEAKGDLNRASLKNPKEKRVQLGSALEKVALVFRGPVNDAIEKVCNSCKKYMNNPFNQI